MLRCLFLLHSCYLISPFSSDGEIHLDTPYSRLLGKPPIMVAGMTPSTVKAGFVSAVLDAAYHIELAGGGHYNAAALRSKVAEIQKQIPARVGITLNSLYINPRQFTFQLPLWQEMRKEGLPIEGFCVAAGVPTTEKAVEIIDGLKTAGIRHVAFKPGSVDGIRQVVNIALVYPPSPSPYDPRSSYSPSLGPYSESGFSFGAAGKTDPTQARSQPPSFILIDDDIDILKERLHSLRLNQHPQPASFGLRKRPSLSAHHRPRSSSQISRAVGINAHKQSSRVIIMHFTSLGNYKLLKDVMQSIMASYANSSSLVPEVMIIPKPAGPRRFLTALHTAVTKPNVDPFFSPIATSPASPAAPLSTGTSFIGSPTSEPGPSTHVHNGGSPQSLSPSTKNGNRPHSSRTNSDRSSRSGDSVNKSFANVLPSPLALPENVEYFSTSTQRLGFSPSSGLVIQSPDGQPAGIYFHPRSKTSRTASSQSMERDRGQLSVPTPRRSSTSRMASGGRKDDYFKGSSFGVSPPVDNENEMGPPSSSPVVSGKQLSTMSALSQEIHTHTQSSSILAPVPRKPSNISRKNSSPSTSPAEGSRRGLGRRPSAGSKGSITPPAPSKQKGKVLASDTNVVPPISVLIVDGTLCFRLIYLKPFLVTNEIYVDNPINQTILSTFMKRKKIKYDLASNGQEAVQKWRTGGFHLILVRFATFFFKFSCSFSLIS